MMAPDCCLVENKVATNITVVGAGTMGSGITLNAAMHGFNCFQVDPNSDQLGGAKQYHKKTLIRSVEKNKITQQESDVIENRILYVGSIKETINSDWVIEAATENLVVKEQIFDDLFEFFPRNTILATNTSSISIKKISNRLGDTGGRVIGMHFFNPVPVMKLCEIIKSPVTSQETLEKTQLLAKQMGKTPVLANDFPGFVSNRVLMPMINEAIYTLHENVSSVKGIDTVMILGMSHPMGPLHLADFIGLDVCLSILEVMHEGFGGKKYTPCPLLVNMVANGKLGLKSGEGFYDYSEGPKNKKVAGQFTK